MRLALVTALVAFGIDQLSKIAMLVALELETVGRIEVLPPFLVFRMAWNTGINFGLLSGGPEVTRWLLAAFALLVCVWLLHWASSRERSSLERISAGAIVGGAAGNVLDRVLHGAVVDFLNMSCCGIDNPFVFNLADVAVFLGCIGIAWSAFRPDRNG